LVSRIIDDYRNQSRNFADTENHHDGNEVDEARQGLHHVENRVDACLCPVGPRHQDADRDADDDGDESCDRGDRERDHRIVPKADKADERHSERGTDGDADAAAAEIDDGEDDGENNDPRRVGEQPFQEVQEPLQGLDDRIDKAGIFANKALEPLIDDLARFTDGSVADRRKATESVRQKVAGCHDVPLYRLDFWRNPAWLPERLPDQISVMHVCNG
jgi:hypothetical protein